MKEFVPNTLGLKILGAGGKYVDFAGVAYMGDRPIWQITFSNKKTLRCTASHRVICPTGVNEIQELKKGDQVYRGDGKLTRVTAVKDTGLVEPVYEIIEASDGHRYVSEGVLSHQCEFITDDETLIDPIKLAKLSGKRPEFYTNTVRWYHNPEPNKTYLVSLDPSVGTGGDYAAIQVFMLPDMIQVAEWQHNRTVAKHQVRIMMQILLFIDATMRDDLEQSGEPEIYWTVENNTIGEHILGIIEDTGEDRFPGTFVSEKKKKGQVRRFRKGMNTDNKKKLSACAKLKSLVESGRMKINSNNLIKELKNFVSKESSFSAKPGENDDLVSATLLVVRMLDVVIHWGAESGDLKEYIGDEELYDDEPMPVVF